MKHLTTAFLFFLTSISAFAQQPPDQQNCYRSSENTVVSLLSTDISGLQLDLYLLSKFQPEKPEDVVNLQKIATGAVFSLANTINAHSSSFQRCLLPEETNTQEEAQANTMALILDEIFGFELWARFVLVGEDWPLENTPPLVGHLSTNKAIRGKRLPMHPVIENTLRAYAREWQQIDNTDPVQIAALEMLGQEPNWDIKRFKLINFFQLYQGSALDDEFYGEGFREKSTSERLAIVADRYFKQ